MYAGHLPPVELVSKFIEEQVSKLNSDSWSSGKRGKREWSEIVQVRRIFKKKNPLGFFEFINRIRRPKRTSRRRKIHFLISELGKILGFTKLESPKSYTPLRIFSWKKPKTSFLITRL